MKPNHTWLAILAMLAIGLLPAPRATAHCDTMDGPVVQAGQRALEAGDVNVALIWVQKPNEPEIRATFQQALAVRKLGPEARELADRYWFETLVRVHRAGEGEPYTGLKPAGQDLGPAIPAVDKALQARSIEPVVKLVSEAVERGIHHRFDAAMKAAAHKDADVEAGRQYVRAYVELLHYVERLYALAGSSAAHAAHAANAGEAAHPGDGHGAAPAHGHAAPAPMAPAHAPGHAAPAKGPAHDGH